MDRVYATQSSAMIGAGAKAPTALFRSANATHESIVAAGCRKVVKSSFYETDEMVFPDGQERTDKDGKKLTSSIKDGALVTDIIGTVANWTETVQADTDDKSKYAVTYAWKNAASGEAETCTQHFVRKV